MYFRSISKCFNALQLYSVERLREINGGDEHWEHPILCSVAPAFCTPSSDPQFDVSVCILIGQLADKGQTLGEAWCTTVWRTICTRQAEYKLGGHYQHPARLLFVKHFDQYSSPRLWSAVVFVQYFIEDLSYHFFVSSSHLLMSSALISLLSLHFPRLSRSMAV